MLERGVLYTGIYVWAYSLFLSFLKVNYKYFEIFLIYVIKKKCMYYLLFSSKHSVRIDLLSGSFGRDCKNEEGVTC